MKLTAQCRDETLKFITSVSGQELIKHLQAKSPKVLWDAKGSIESYAIASAENRGWHECLLEIANVITPKQGDN